jgi:hypothetical protein
MRSILVAGILLAVFGLSRLAGVSRNLIADPPLLLGIVIPVTIAIAFRRFSLPERPAWVAIGFGFAVGTGLRVLELETLSALVWLISGGTVATYAVVRRAELVSKQNNIASIHWSWWVLAVFFLLMTVLLAPLLLE